MLQRRKNFLHITTHMHDVSTTSVKQLELSTYHFTRRSKYSDQTPNSRYCLQDQVLRLDASMSARGTAKARSNGDVRPQKELSTGLWLLKHTQGIVTTATAMCILHLRTSHVVYFTIGTLSTSFTAKGLKRVIKQPRPPGSKVKKTSGMPSTHSS